MGKRGPGRIITTVAAIRYYLWGGRDGDTGAMIGSRADERQRLVRMQTRSFACGGAPGQGRDLLARAVPTGR